MRSTTVRETRISFGPARSAIRLAVCTAMPAMSGGRSSISPVCNPARSVMLLRCGGVEEFGGAPDCAGGAVEGRQDPIAGLLHDAAAVLGDDAVGGVIEIVE